MASAPAAAPKARRRLRALALGLVRVMLGLLLAIAILWAAGAIMIDLPAARPVRIVALAAWLIVVATLLWQARRRRWPRLAAAVMLVAVPAWWLSILPSNDRHWQADVARTAFAEIDGDRVIIHNVRDFIYHSQTDMTPRYETRAYRLSSLTGIDLFQCYWGSPWIAHPIISFDFGAEGRVCFSIETRKEVGEEYSTLTGFYRQFEVIYVVADERDVVRLRTSVRPGEDVYLYRLHLSAEHVRQRFTEYVHRLNQLHRRPEFYNAVTGNCTTSIRLQHASDQRAPWDYRMLLNGKIDELLHERGLLDGNLPFHELKRRAHINDRANASDSLNDFSARIRAMERPTP